MAGSSGWLPWIGDFSEHPEPGVCKPRGNQWVEPDFFKGVQSVDGLLQAEFQGARLKGRGGDLSERGRIPHMVGHEGSIGLSGIWAVQQGVED